MKVAVGEVESFEEEETSAVKMKLTDADCFQCVRIISVGK